jgi:hypothetical protein
VLFLAWNNHLSGFEVTWPESVYRLSTDGTISVHGEATNMAQAQRGRNSEDFVAELKRIAAAQGVR